MRVLREYLGSNDRCATGGGERLELACRDGIVAILTGEGLLCRFLCTHIPPMDVL